MVTKVEKVSSVNLEHPLELSSWQKFIFPAILWSLHQVLNVLTLVWLQLCHFWKVCITASSKKLTFQQIAKSSEENLTKVPRHIAFGFLENESNVSIEKVARMVVWAVASGVGYVSLYDIVGSLKDQRRYLLSEIFNQLALLCNAPKEELSNSFHFYLHPHSDEHETDCQNELKKTTVFRCARKIHISLLSCHDGRADIVKAAQRLADRSNHQVDLNLINEDMDYCQRNMSSALESYLNRMVSIITMDGRNFVGTLKGFDQTINIILEDTHERVFSSVAGVEQVVLGLHILRGENVAVIGEVDEDMDKRWDLAQVRADPILSIVR